MLSVAGGAGACMTCGLVEGHKSAMMYGGEWIPAPACKDCNPVLFSG
jgi:hypothetical protein